MQDIAIISDMDHGYEAVKRVVIECLTKDKDYERVCMSERLIGWLAKKYGSIARTHRLNFSDNKFKP